MALLACLALTAATAVPFSATDDPAPRPVAPIPGALMLAGDGTLPECVLHSFLLLSGGRDRRIVLVSCGAPAPKTKAWEKAGATSVQSLRLNGPDDALNDDALVTLLEANGVWFEQLTDRMVESPRIRSLLCSALERGAAVGAAGDAAPRLATGSIGRNGTVEHNGFGFLPDSLVLSDFSSSKERTLSKALQREPGSIGWGIPKGTALVFHHGRKVGAMGKGQVTAMLAEHNEWPGRTERIRAVDVVDHGDLPPYRIDLLAWRRSAQQRLGPLFPPAEAPKPEIPGGTLILQGGGGVSEETFQRFIKEAGGKDAVIVCIPSASEFDPGEEPDSYSEDELRNEGCTNLFVLHTSRCSQADDDEAFLEPLTRATGVWIDGGRTYRVMDCYQHTRVHSLIREVLERGGVVGGSSAGCQVMGDFLVRGNPRSNKDITHEGYTTGFGFLPGVILDVHFLERNRGAEFLELIQTHPQLLGIGIDAGTALVVQGSVGEVLGESVVTLFDTAQKPLNAEGFVLEHGETYDLARRRPVK